MGVIGREFNFASVSMTTVSNSSYVKSAVDTVRINKLSGHAAAAAN